MINPALHSFEPVLDMDDPPPLRKTIRVSDNARTPAYILGWMVPGYHLDSLEFNGHKYEYTASAYMVVVVKPLFEAAFPEAEAHPRALSGMDHVVIYLTMNTPERVWLDKLTAQRRQEMVQWMMQTLKLRIEPKWYRVAWDHTMLPRYREAWPEDTFHAAPIANYSPASMGSR
uniref:Uncharacterized protein n=1 Tax=Mycena chlorophos TaxID=658473 RepID=A0ABQ0L057_MYCCL|nr:predicted protein [Mycena chlorophos]